jgi:hypothetical protein
MKYVNNLCVQIDTYATLSYTTTTTMHTHKLLDPFQVINNHAHPISQHSHFRNSLNSFGRRRNYRNRWHLLHHVLPLEELTTSSLKHKIGYTQYHTQPQSKYKHACITKDVYRKVGAPVEHMMKVLLCGWLVPAGKNIAIQAIYPPCMWDDYYSIVWALSHDCYLREDKGSERET